MPTKNKKEASKEEQEELEVLGAESLRRGKPPGDNEDLVRFDFNPGDEKDPAAMLKAIKEMVEKYKKKETAEPEQ